jgi:hypothetical protein
MKETKKKTESKPQTSQQSKEPSIAFGVKLQKVDIELLREACEKCEIPTEGKAKIALVETLIRHFRTENEVGDLVKCDNCGGISTPDFELCPFCGVGDEESGVVAVDGVVEKSDDEADPDVEVNVETVEEFEEEVPAVEEVKAEVIVPVAKKRGRPRKEATAIAKIGNVEISQPGSPEMDGFTVTDLNSALEKVIALKTETSKNYWLLGKENQLWKLRKSDDGKYLYRSFDAFCLAEIRMSGAQCYKMMDVAASFDEEQISKFGMTKLNLVLQAPKEDQTELLSEAASASSRKLAEKVSEKRKEKGVEKRDTGRKQIAAKSKGRQSEYMTIANILGKTKIRLFQKPTKRGEELQPASDISQSPFGYTDLPNGVREMYGLEQDQKGYWYLRIERKRVEE